MKNIKELKPQWSNREYVLFIIGVAYMYHVVTFTIRINHVYQNPAIPLRTFPEELMTVSFDWWWVIVPVVVLAYVVKQSFTPITQVLFYIILTLFLLLFL